MLMKPATTDQPIHPLLRDRWSPRAFDEVAIPAEQVLGMLEAARWSPSGGNVQPWSFIVAPREDQATFDALLSTLHESNQVWAQHAPLLILTVARLTRDNGAPNAYALYDLGQAAAHLSVQAAALGLVAHQMAGFDQERARAAFAIPAEYAPVTVIAIGHIGDHTALPEALREREQAPRTRKPLDTIAFGGTWGQPIALLPERAVAGD